MTAVRSESTKSEKPKWIIKDSIYKKPEAGGPIKVRVGQSGVPGTMGKRGRAGMRRCEVWHRSSWDTRFLHAEKHRGAARGRPTYTVEPESTVVEPAVEKATHPVYIRRHTHTHTFSQGRGHTHTTTLRRTGRAGMPGGPLVVANYGAFCSELGQRVEAINRTLDSLKMRCEKLRLNELQNLPEDEDTAYLRKACNQSVAHQIEFHQQCMEIWTAADESTGTA